MASYETYRSSASSKSISPLSEISTRRQSSTSQLQPSPTLSSPRVQLVPHSRHPSYDASLSPSELELVSNTNFDSKDMSSKDFDFEDVFTYDKPQRKLKSVIEVQMTSPSREWSNFSFSHYPSAANMRQKVNSRMRSNAAEMLMKNQSLMKKK